MKSMLVPIVLEYSTKPQVPNNDNNQGKNLGFDDQFPTISGVTSD